MSPRSDEYVPSFAKAFLVLKTKGSYLAIAQECQPFGKLVAPLDHDLGERRQNCRGRSQLVLKQPLEMMLPTRFTF